MKRRQCGWLMIEVLVTISILLMLAGALGAVVFSAGKANRKLWALQQAQAAVEAQLDCMSRAAVPLPAEEFERLWPGFSYTIETVAGSGPTEGLERVEVTVTGRIHNRLISVTGQRYISKRKS